MGTRQVNLDEMYLRCLEAISKEALEVMKYCECDLPTALAYMQNVTLRRIKGNMRRG